MPRDGNLYMVDSNRTNPMWSMYFKKPFLVLSLKCHRTLSPTSHFYSLLLRIVVVMD